MWVAFMDKGQITYLIEGLVTPYGDIDLGQH